MDICVAVLSWAGPAQALGDPATIRAVRHPMTIPDGRRHALDEGAPVVRLGALVLVPIVGVLAALSGCTPDNKLNPVDPSNDGTLHGPAIEVLPDQIVFDTLAIGDDATQDFAVMNVGDATLNVASMEVQGSGAFTLLTSVEAFALEPGDSTVVNVVFSPLAPEEFGQVHIASDDLSNPDALVDLTGTGMYPELRISPDPLDFGEVRVGCTREEPIYLMNVGAAPVTVTSMVQIGDGFEFDIPDLPFEIEAGGELTLPLTVLADHEGSFRSEIVVTSNDTVSTQSAEQYAHGTTDDSVEEEFWQGDGPWDATDILFYVDQSGSMADNQRTLQANFSNFAYLLDYLELDWQVMAVTRDNGCHNGSFITAGMPGANEAFTSAVNGMGGVDTERGLTIAYEALSKTAPGQCNEGFLRDGAKTTIVLISDELEQSAGRWDTWVSNILAIAPSASITSIAGDIPDGCFQAEPGYGYYEASVATHGAFLSICGEDWSGYFETIANMSATGQISTFYLDSHPDPEAIVVKVNDVPQTDGWSYDEAQNAIVFGDDDIPPPGAHIVVSFALPGDCEG
jgi:hypothetical protein